VDNPEQKQAETADISGDLRPRKAKLHTKVNLSGAAVQQWLM